MPKKSKLPLIVFLVILTGLAGFAFSKRALISDYLAATAYSPTSEMIKIRSSLGLTNRGTLIFNATHPRLDSRDEFNFDCDSSDPDIAVYGCYTSDRIYIYNIDNPELSGFREATTAHELLHAVWYRLPLSEKNNLIPLLETVYSENKSLLEEDLENYPDSERIDELYVRAATQIKSLPAELEAHYSKIFSDQDRIVDFYLSYIAPFEELEKKIESLGAELESEKAIIDQKTAEYESRSDIFNREVDEFNSCAETAGCFSPNYEFNLRRNELLNTASDLDALYAELGNLIDAYNIKIDEYNSNILHNNTLQNLVNSNSKPEDLN